MSGEQKLTEIHSIRCPAYTTDALLKRGHTPGECTCKVMSGEQKTKTASEIVGAALLRKIERLESVESENAALKEMIGDILASYEQYGELPSDIIDRAKKLIAENRE